MLAFVDSGELAGFNGLNLRMAEMILLAMDCRVLRRIPRQFKVASTRIASLQPTDQGFDLVVYDIGVHTWYLG